MSWAPADPRFFFLFAGLVALVRVFRFASQARLCMCESVLANETVYYVDRESRTLPSLTVAHHGHRYCESRPLKICSIPDRRLVFFSTKAPDLVQARSSPHSTKLEKVPTSIRAAGEVTPGSGQPAFTVSRVCERRLASRCTPYLGLLAEQHHQLDQCFYEKSLGDWDNGQHDGILANALCHQRDDRGRAGYLLCVLRSSLQLANPSTRKGASHSESRSIRDTVTNTIIVIIIIIIIIILIDTHKLHKGNYTWYVFFVFSLSSSALLLLFCLRNAVCWTVNMLESDRLNRSPA
ncbi:predicted protein [Plenodomus lingam JN3]|uniref:Uncharacterized protein n=1 Tax=Leptosphaeria maculans (strain JN3 / isolate v23.1.3 / race Av1-4-5-6-7-8) TaxID=985895 RepID=E5A675_LEPMJ|nr:predicted protein [Plenodomus lingam JN3]CBX99120.1 predicted protein [Plenodomus lingam JN3]